MTILMNNNDESEQTQLGIGWTTILSVSGNVGGDTLLRLLATAEYCGTLTGEGVAIRILIDGTERNRDSFRPVATDAWRTATFLGAMDVSAGSHSLEIQHTAETATQTVRSRRARIIIDQR